MMRCCRAPVRTADDRDRIGRVLEQIEQCAHRPGTGRLGDRRDGWAVGNIDQIAQHVFGQGEHDWPGSAGGGDAVGAGDIFGDSRRIVDPRRPFGDRPEEGRHVDFLEALTVAVGAVEVADEQDHRSRILECDMNARRCIGRAWAARYESDAWSPGHLAVGVGHVGHSAFLSAYHQVDFGRVVKRVEDREETFPRHGENAVAALDSEAARRGFGRRCVGS